MREETRPPKQTICVVCKHPITPTQRPSIEMENGDQVHAECWNKARESERRKVN